MPVKGGEWGGGGNDSGASGNSWVGQTSSNFPAWGNDDVYNDYYPEHRIYAFTVSDGNDKVFYKFSFMMMSTNPRAKVDATSCPDGTCNTTKAFFLIEQVTAP